MTCLKSLLLIAYGGMGASALAYEILWTRMLSLLFGVGIFGVVFTVAAFMAGLGAGSLLASRCCTGWSPRRSLQTVAILEFGIAAYALMLPICMPAIDGWLTETGTTLTLAQWQSFQGVASILILFPAALAMGFAFPLALRAARACGLGVSDMYGVNALGGAMGGIAPLFLLPGFGLNDSVWCVAAFATLMAILALLVARALPAEGEVSTQSTVQRPPFIDLLAYAGIGAAALMLEILWTRIYGMVLLRTEYVLAVLLLVYLVGVGFGSIAAKWLKASWWLNILPVLAAVLAVAGQYLLPSISQWANRATFDSLAQAMLAQGFVILLCTLPVTLVLGAWLPVLARHFDGTSGTQSCGWWYGANSLGAALGVLFAGLIAVPFIGAAMSLVVAALLLMICGFRWLNNVRFWLALPCLLLLMWPVKQLPAVSALLPSLHDGRDIFLYEDAVATTHVVERDNGQRVLLSDLQRMDASSDPTAVIVQKNQARLPLLLHADPKSVLFLGLGTGVTASGALAFSPERCVAVELSLGAIQAASDTFYPVNNGVMQKIDVVHDDVRRFLRRDNARYDVIVGDLFHPDMVGRGNLLSRQEFERVRNRLHEGGIFVQWLALNQFDIASLQVVLHTFAQVFDDASVFVDGYRLAMVGTYKTSLNASALSAHIQSLAGRNDFAGNPDDMTGGEGIWTWLGRYWGGIPDTWEVKTQDEWSPVIEYALPRVRYDQSVDMHSLWQWMLSWKDSMTQAGDALHVAPQDLPQFQRAWAGSAIDVRLWMAELKGQEDQALEWARLALKANALDRWPRTAIADRMFDSLHNNIPDGMSYEQALVKILAIEPGHEGAIRQMLQQSRDKDDQQAIKLWMQRLHDVSPLAIEQR